MYNPDDNFIQTLIDKGVRNLLDAVHESTDKERTRNDICKKLEKELGFSVDIETI